MAILNIGKDFNRDPAGRFYTDGVGSGEEFREEYLIPALKKLDKNEKLKITLDDDVLSYGSSFLVEGFAGLVKHGYFEKKFVLDTLEFAYSDSDFELYESRIISYINDAKYNSEKYASTKIQ